jgi:hypothetical protein
MFKDTARVWEATNDDQLTFQPGTTTVTITDVKNTMSFFDTVPFWSNANWKSNALRS